MIENTGRCIDPSGEAYLVRTLDEIGRAMSCADANEAAIKLKGIFDSLELEVPTATEEQFEVFRNSVNPVRLENHPMALDVETINFLYHEILNGEVK